MLVFFSRWVKISFYAWALVVYFFCVKELKWIDVNLLLEPLPVQAP